MNRFFNAIFTIIKVRFITLISTVKFIVSPLWWRTKGLELLRNFFNNLLSVKPRDKKDYYSVLGWLISKKLAFAITIIVGALSAFYIFALSPVSEKLKGAGETLPTYNYNSIALKLAKGEVGIKAKSGYVAYIGQVEKGRVKGKGKLFLSNGALLYEGDFDNNAYQGRGKLYYNTGELKYDGDFSENFYNGEGKQYRVSGSLEYDGEFLSGRRDGLGKLYDASGNKIYEGNFRFDEILYSDFLDKTTSEISALYSGAQSVYSYKSDYCVSVKDIGAVYEADSSQNSLEAELIVKKIVVAKDKIKFGAREFNDINKIIEAFGSPDYRGEKLIDIGEAVAINSLEAASNIGKVKVNATSVFDDVFEINDYDEDFSAYVFAFKLDGLLYTFYYSNYNSGKFFMYSITAD